MAENRRRVNPSSFELDPIDQIAVGTVGSPGARQFFLQARSHGQLVTLACEKFQIQGLVLRIQQLLESNGLGSELDVGPTPSADEPLIPIWTVGELGLGYHEGRRMFVIVAREMGESDEEHDAEDDAESSQPAEPLSGAGASARFWAGANQVRAFARQAEQVLRSGRPVCTYCGLPMDPGGHPCPASDGARPIF